MTIQRREVTLLNMLKAGLSKTQIAQALFMERSRVSEAMRDLRRRFGCKNDFQLALKANDMGLWTYNRP